MKLKVNSKSEGRYITVTPSEKITLYDKRKCMGQQHRLD